MLQFKLTFAVINHRNYRKLSYLFCCSMHLMVGIRRTPTLKKRFFWILVCLKGQICDCKLVTENRRCDSSQMEIYKTELGSETKINRKAGKKYCCHNSCIRHCQLSQWSKGHCFVFIKSITWDSYFRRKQFQCFVTWNSICQQ